MGRLTEILQLAQSRAIDFNLTYEGALTPKEADEVLRLAPGARLVDVRSRAELDWVGRIPGAVEIEWQTYPGNHANLCGASDRNAEHRHRCLKLQRAGKCLRACRDHESRPYSD